MTVPSSLPVTRSLPLWENVMDVTFALFPLNSRCPNTVMSSFVAVSESTTTHELEAGTCAHSVPNVLEFNFFKLMNVIYFEMDKFM